MTGGCRSNTGFQLPITSITEEAVCFGCLLQASARPSVWPGKGKLWKPDRKTRILSSRSEVTVQVVGRQQYGNTRKYSGTEHCKYSSSRMSYAWDSIIDTRRKLYITVLEVLLYFILPYRFTPGSRLPCETQTRTDQRERIPHQHHHGGS
jgi:hypothetical protein